MTDWRSIIISSFTYIEITFNSPNRLAATLSRPIRALITRKLQIDCMLFEWIANHLKPIESHWIEFDREFAHRTLNPISLSLVALIDSDTAKLLLKLSTLANGLSNQMNRFDDLSNQIK